MAKKQPQNRRVKPTVRDRLSAYLTQHRETFIAALGKVTRHPFATLMTALVIGISLAMPAGLYVLLSNVDDLTGQFDGSVKVSVFLDPEASNNIGVRLRGQIAQRREVDAARFISKEEGLEELRATEGFDAGLDLFDANNNPLPAVVEVQPRSTDKRSILELKQQLEEMEFVDRVQVDQDWLARLQVIEANLEQLILVIASLLGIGVLLVVGNTVRLDIYNQRDEIEVLKMVGGTDGFIRKPFVYAGFWYGIFGGLIAFVFVQFAVIMMDDLVKEFARTYGTSFTVSGLGLIDSIVLVAGGGLLCLMGAWVSVTRHLQNIEPGDKFA